MQYNEEQATYYTYKLFLAIIFNHNNNFYKLAYWLYDVNNFTIFKNCVGKLCKKGILGQTAKNNIYNVITEARDIYDDDRQKRISICNEMLTMVNMSKDESIYFYINEIGNRLETKRRVKKLTEGQIYERITAVHDSFTRDFAILYSHGYDIDDETYENEYLSYFIDDPAYYISLYIILEECPDMFNDKLFLKRIAYTINHNNLRDRSMERIIRKKIKQNYKK